MIDAQAIADYRLRSYGTPEAARASLRAEIQNHQEQGDPFDRLPTLRAAWLLLEPNLNQKEGTNA